MEKKYNQYNFHKHTFCVYKQVDSSVLKVSKVDYKSKSGSSYYFIKEGVYRISNHWGRAANCRWRLISNEKIKSQTEKCGFAKWTDFYSNSETEKLFYIEVNWKLNKVTFQHRNNPSYPNSAILRNAAATAKIIQTIKEVLTTTKWANHLIFDDLEALRKDVVTVLIEKEETFLQIKQRFI